MLAIGGMTVEELRQRMTQAELLRWFAYAEIHGPLNPMIRLDAGFARVVQAWRGGTLREYMPWPKEPEREATIADFMQILRSARKPEK